MVVKNLSIREVCSYLRVAKKLKKDLAFTRQKWGNQYIALGIDDNTIIFYDYNGLARKFSPTIDDLKADDFYGFE